MPKARFPARQLTKVTVTDRKVRDDSCIVGDTFRLSVGISLTVSANYQSIKLDCGIAHDAPVSKKSKAYEQAWDLCNNEIARNLEDAKTTLSALGGS